MCKVAFTHTHYRARNICWNYTPNNSEKSETSITLDRQFANRGQGYSLSNKLFVMKPTQEIKEGYNSVYLKGSFSGKIRKDPEKH